MRTLNDAHCDQIVEAVITDPDDLVGLLLEALEFNVEHK